MTIQELKITSFIMTSLFSFEGKYKEIASKRFDQNLSKDDCKLIMKFLNDWGCRQFKKENHNEASKSLINWHNESFKILPHHSLGLIDQNDNEILKYCQIFDSLKGSYASTNKRGIGKTFGPVGAAKTLFALRKNMFPPWDNAIIKELNLTPDGEGYIKYLYRVKKELLDLKIECDKNNIDIEQLPSEFNSKCSSLVKLIDEFFWLTMTRKFKPLDLINKIKK
jgi:hypothetical protein